MIRAELHEFSLPFQKNEKHPLKRTPSFLEKNIVRLVYFIVTITVKTIVNINAIIIDARY